MTESQEPIRLNAWTACT